MYPVTNDDGLYVMPYPEQDWTEMQCPCAGLGAPEVWGVQKDLLSHGYEGVGATGPTASLPPAWKWAVALSLTGATIWLAMRWADKQKERA